MKLIVLIAAILIVAANSITPPVIASSSEVMAVTKQVSNQSNCSSAYPDVCIPDAPPNLNCKDIPFRNFRVLPPDPHRFDKDRDGIGCEVSGKR